MEEWRDIPGCPEYQVSNLGNLRRKKTRQQIIGCFRTGARRYTVRNGPFELTQTKSDNVSAAKLVAIAFLGASRYSRVTHKNGDRLDNRPSNLEVK